ncbi:MAG TPA: cytochrome c [Kofleriaceae bacterium]|nr:cytochrome c [Kofleriaceae bacterium]
MLGGAAAMLSLSLTGCMVGEVEDVGVAAAGGADVPPVFLEQGWNQATRAAFYQQTQGSRMLPYTWFLHLEEATSRQKFRNASNMRRMGFLVDEASALNPDRLPVGFARDSEPGKSDEVGLTCAACHTGELEYNGTRVRIDGGQGLGDLEQLQNGILAALNATLADGAKFDRFAAAIRASDKTALRAQMQTERDWWSRRVTRSKGLTPHGPSRVDAFTVIGNEVVCDMFGIPENCAPGIAPTQFPFLWGTPDFEWAQYNSSVHSPLGRNVGEVTGVFAEARVTANGVESSADLEGLHALETMLKDLRAPAWPAEILGTIDPALAAQGETLYAQNCASCHPTSAPTVTNMYGRTMTKVDFSTPLFNPTTGAPILGTDRTAALTFATRRAYPGPFAGIEPVKTMLTTSPDGKVPAVVLLSISGSSIIQRFFALNQITGLAALGYLDYRESRTATNAQLVTYKARPLDGVAFTAPYLHNGSVPSMYELLLPPAQRTTSFYVGNPAFDPVDLGYSTERITGAVLLDTTAVGNGNGGHVYGTTLSDPERYALIEYIKTLD